MDSSDEASNAPTKAEIRRIAAAIQEALKQHDAETDPTINNIRNKAEEALGLGQNFLRTDPFWKDESKKIIKDEFEKQNAGAEVVAEVVKVPKSRKSEPKKKTTPSKPASKSTRPPENLDEDEAPKKPARVRGKAQIEVAAAVESEDSALSEPEEAMSEVEDAPPKKKRGRPKADAPKGRPPKKIAKTAEAGPAKEENIQIVGKQPEPALSIEAIPTVPEAGSEKEPEAAKEEAAKEESESEMSEVIDISPKKRKKQRSSDGATKSKSSSKASSKPAAKARATKKGKDTGDADPDAEKIKELQSWLVRCGIRKVWGRELQKCSSPKEKIDHLRGMLTDAGMTGRFSNEKAKKIKEERELAEELAAVQAGAEAWGTSDTGVMKTRSARSAEAPPKTRRLVRAPELAFLDDQSSESD
ncbi:hypothetical protein DFH27DRAFT_567203 [Peziza echinospora]|nr:hypothetical protein DFH27DRAFT_567203 [Peziza echinospora]